MSVPLFVRQFFFSTIPKLLSAIDISNTIVTIDAMGCQTSITEKIIDGKGDYVIALKENQKTSYKLAKGIIDEYVSGGNCKIATRHCSANEGHGRLEERKCIVVSYGDITEKIFKKKFNGLKSIVGVIPRRTVVATGETSEEACRLGLDKLKIVPFWRYYFISLPETNSCLVLSCQAISLEHRFVLFFVVFVFDLFC